MPHQCVVCGAVYPNGSKEILTGCSVCGGRKFYYIKTPVPKEDLRVISEQVSHDLDNIVTKILQDIPEERYREDGTPDKAGEWVKVEVTGEEDRSRVERLEAIKDKVSSGVLDRIKFGNEGAMVEKDDLVDGRKRRKISRKRKLRISKVSEYKKGGPPVVVTVVERGVYEINIKALLEHSPIVIQKDGSYLIHLPSLFQIYKNEGKEV